MQHNSQHDVMTVRADAVRQAPRPGRMLPGWLPAPRRDVSECDRLRPMSRPSAGHSPVGHGRRASARHRGQREGGRHLRAETVPHPSLAEGRHRHHGSHRLQHDAVVQTGSRCRKAVQIRYATGAMLSLISHVQVRHGYCRVVFVFSVMSSNVCYCVLISSMVFCSSLFSSHSFQISLYATLPSHYWSSQPPFILPFLVICSPCQSFFS